MRTNSRYVSDTVLSDLARRLQDIHFEERFDEHREFIELGLDDRLMNVDVLMDGKTYRVRMYLGGKQRGIGITTNGAHAARFADMARLFFWPYRVRDARPPLASDMNFSVQQAEDDLRENEDAKMLLEAILSHLIDIGAIVVRQPGKQEKEKRTSLGGAIRQELLEFRMEHESAMQESAKAQKALFEDLKKAFHHIRDRLDTLEKYILPPPDTTPGHPDNPNFDPKFCSKIP